jgi:spermidine/putrescine transport system permease protein
LRRERRQVILGTAPLALCLIVLLAGALINLLIQSFWQVRDFAIVIEWTLKNYRDVVLQHGPTLIRTMLMGSVIALITLSIAYPFAYAIHFKLDGHPEFWVLLIMLTIFTGYLVKIYAWKAILGSQGLINATLISSGVVSKPLDFLLYSPVAVVITLVNALIPFAILPIYSALKNVPYSLIEASKDLGAGRLKTLWHVTLPLSRQGLQSAFAITFILSSGDYFTPQMLGGPSGQMLGQMVATRFGVGYDWPMGSAFAFTILVSAFLTYWLFVRLTNALLG